MNPVIESHSHEGLRNIFRLGIRQKVALVLLITLLTALTVSGWQTLRSQQADILRESNLRGSELTRFTAQSLLDRVVSHDYHAIEQWLQQAVQQHEDIVYLRVISDRGNTMAETGVPPGQDADVVIFNEDIRVDNERVGQVILGLSTRRITETFHKQRLSLVTSEFVVIVLIALVEFMALSFIILRPITRFSGYLAHTQTLGETPGPSDTATADSPAAPLPVQSKDEIGDLARSFLHLQERSRAATDELRLSEKRNRALVEAMPDMMFRLRHDGFFVDCKIPPDMPAPFSAKNLIGRHALAALPADLSSTLMHHLNLTLATREPQTFHYQREDQDGTHNCEARIAPGAEGEALVLVRDITEQKHLEEKVRFLAQFDGLTQLPNRFLFKERLRSVIEHAAHGNYTVAVLAMDLDHFKVVNDTLGHDAGDQLLQGVAERLQRCLRGTDYIARQTSDDHGVMVSRTGGDEFTLLLTQLPDVNHAAGVAQRVLDALKAPLRIAGHDLSVSASFGIAVYPNDGADAETLIKNADAAMHHAKSDGRGQYRFYTAAMNTSFSRRLELEARLRRALEQDELRVYYQPQVDVASGKVIGAEALLRWTSVDMGNISPAEFIPLAEDTGLIVPIGQWVLRTACNDARAWQGRGLPPIRVAVNVSGVQFRQPDFVAMVRECLSATGLPPHCLELEVTEGVLLHGHERVIQMLSELKALGIHLALDDFGTGYSSLSYLKRFPLDILKIDRAFVRDINDNADDSELASAIIAMAHSLTLKVVAEGVETAAQLDFLRGKGCDYMQGYLFSPAITSERLADMLGKDARADTAA